MDVGGWLRGLGLGQYEEKFRDNKIDADLLPRLTVDDLKDIGVSVVGDRRRLLDAIAAIAGAGPPADVPASATKSAAPKGLQASAERRPITVMFCDLVGSTSLAAKLDAEDWRNLVNAYLDEASKAVTGLGGHVLKKLGDGLMALFGYPHAQENDAERAVRAALAIQRALADLNARNTRSGAPQLSARIGIECGSVVVDAGGEVFGEAPNVAARVQAAAEPGSVLITGSVQRQVAGLFVVEEKGAHELKGVTQPLSLYRVVRASGGGRRGGVRALTQFVGREDDIGTLFRRWDRVRAGGGQFVQIVGEPGLGKSRLVEEFHARLGETPHTWVEWNSSQLLQNTPLHPVAEWGRARFGGQDVAAERRLADLETTLAQVKLDVQETATLLAPLLDIPLPAERAPTFGPEELRRRQLAAMVALLLAGARTQPVVLAFEDLHWADPTSLDLMRALAERGAQAPLLVIATTRPEFRPPWGMRSHHAVVALAPLNRPEVRRMVSEIASQHALPQEVVERVGDRTGGVPLFVEEVTRLLLERGDSGSPAVPPTLQQSLAARLDRLGPAREVAQIGAVLGRDFAYPLLRNIAEADEATLQSSLERLAESDLLFVDGAPPQANYRFKHALIQDAAYDSLLKSRRQTLHRRAAEILRDDPDRAAAEPELVAHHFTQAGLDELAIEWWGKAGDQALRRSAFQEAIAHLGKAIEMADKSAGATSRQWTGDAASSKRLKLQTDYGQAVMWSKGFAADETKTAFARATELAARTDDFSERFAALHGQWNSALVRGELRSARELASTFLREAEEEERVMEAGVAHRGLALICYSLGEFFEARNHCQRALETCDPERDQEARERSGEDTWTFATWLLAFTSWKLGDVERARELLEAADRRATELGHGPTMAGLLLGKTYLAVLRGDVVGALTAAEALEAFSGKLGLALFGGWAKLFAAWAQGRLHDPSRGAAELRQALAALADLGARILAPFGLGLLAELEAETLGAERALSRVDEALTLAREIDHRSELAFLHRLRGDILFKHDPANSAPAEEAFQTALSVAKEQGARSWGLRTALSLAKLYQSTNKAAEAHAVLAPALEGFSPTPEMPEIAEAQGLLAALAETDEVKAAEVQRQRRLHLQTAYGQAMMWAKGFAAEETSAAFSRATQLAAKTDSFADRFAAGHFQWTFALLRGELRSAPKLELSFLKEAEDAGRVVEAGVARRGLAFACYHAADFFEARAHCERALETSQIERERETQERFQYATGPLVMSVLAVTMWQLGEVERARELIEQANRRGSELGDGASKAHPFWWKSRLEILRGDAAAALSAAKALEDLSQEHGMPFWRTVAELSGAWARGRLHDAATGAEDLRRVLADRVDQDAKFDAWFFTGLLAELEAETLGAESALARLDEAMALARQVETRCNLPYLHLLRGKLFLERDPSNPAPAEEAFQTALEIAKQQGARSWGLRAALLLAKLYQSIARPADAHDVLAPALEGFSPTPEMPEIAEAQGLLAALAETDEVKAAEVQRQRRLHLQTAYGQAMMWAKGFAAEETQAAFSRVAEFAGPTESAPERFVAYDAQCLRCFTLGEYAEARKLAETFLREADAAGRATEAGAARRMLGLILLHQGELKAARSVLERALADYVPERDGETQFRFGADTEVSAASYLALAEWHLGEVVVSRQSIDRAVRRAEELGHAAARAHALFLKANLECRRGDATATRLTADALLKLTKESGIRTFADLGQVFFNWALGRIVDPEAGASELSRILAAQLAQGNRAGAPWFCGLVAELESTTLGPQRALTRIDQGLAIAKQNGEPSRVPYLHRLRGDILLKLDPPDLANAEEAYRTGIAIAKQQEARSYELLAALALAKLYSSTGRPAEAHAVLAPELKGFPALTSTHSSPPESGAAYVEMPELQEAEALLAGIAETEQVRSDLG